MPKKESLPPGIHEVSRETIPVQEEFISPEATPSKDENDCPCARCGKPREDWDGPGLEKDDRFYCSEECAEGRG